MAAALPAPDLKAGWRPGPADDVPSPVAVSLARLLPHALLEDLSELGPLRDRGSALPRGPGRLPDGLGDATSAAAGPAGAPETQETSALDALAATSGLAALTLGGWCVFRMSRRRPKDGPPRIVWGEEGSCDFNE
jgi:hypothetical protein